MNFGLKSNFSSERNLSTVDLATPEDCAVGFSTASTIVFLFLSVLCGTAALCGNLALLVAIFRIDSLHQRGGVFITSLAVADLLVGIAMIPLYICYAVIPDDMEPYWLIKIEGFLWIVTVTASTYSLSAVSIDRLISIVSPMRYQQILPEKRCRLIISLIWFGAIVLASPRLVIDDFVQLEKLWITCSVATVVIPFLIMVLSYSKIFAEVKRQNRSVTDNIMARRQAFVERAGNRKAAVTIGIVVVLFVLTFTPSAVVYFLLLFEDNECRELKLNDAWLWVALVSFFHSSCNPWVYGLRSRQLLDFKPAHQGLMRRYSFITPESKPQQTAKPKLCYSTTEQHLPKPVSLNTGNLCGRFVLSFDGDDDWSVLNFLTGGMRYTHRNEPTEQKLKQALLPAQIGETDGFVSNNDFSNSNDSFHKNDVYSPPIQMLMRLISPKKYKSTISTPEAARSSKSKESLD